MAIDRSSTAQAHDAAPPSIAGRGGSLLYSLIAYAIFLGTIGYFFLFVRGIVVPKTIDYGASPFAPAVLVDIAVILLFGVQHSLMARPAFKRWLARHIPTVLERSTFVFVSGATLAVIFWLWQPIPAIAWQLEGAAATIASNAFWAGVLLAVGSTFVFNHTELFGIQQVMSHVRGRAQPIAALRVPLLYRVVRHPMHLGMLTVLWATPLMTLGHLLFAVTMSAYVLVGIHFEERDLVRVFGDSYRAYQQQVPALVPLLRPRVLRAVARRRVVATVGAGMVGAVASLAAVRRPSDAPNAMGAAAIRPLSRDSVRVDGRFRSFAYYAPAIRRGAPPVLVALHGTGGSGERLREFTGGALERLADRYGFVVAYPDAVAGAWNECRSAVSTLASRSGVDDVAMVSRVAEQLARRVGADATRLFALGYSGGGHLAYRLALEASGRLGGVAVFGANLPVTDELSCEPAGTPVPVMIANGTADLINPYGGGVATGPLGQRLGHVRSADASARYFASLAQADTAAHDDVVVVGRGSGGDGGVSRIAWVGRTGVRVALHTVHGGGHAIPGSETRFPSAVGLVERRWNALEEAVRFLGLGAWAP